MPKRLWTPTPKDGDEKPLTCGHARAYVRRATVAFVGLTIVSTGAAYLAYTAGKNGDRHACVERVEGRITQAQGLDDLRRAALSPGAPSVRAQGFLKQTQPAIDTQLSRAAGRVVRADPRLPLTEQIIEPIRRDGVAACDHARTP